CNCKSAGKHPRRKGWIKQASDDQAILRGWFEKFPNANFGVLTGERVMVVDCDMKPGEKDGLASLAKLEADSGQTIPATVTVLSGRGNGSSHLYFKVPQGFSKACRTGFLPGVDMKANNQCVVAPGSRHVTGGYYRF